MRFVFACVCASEQPRWSNSYGISPRDSTGGGSMLSPTGSVGSVGSASGWGGSGSMISPTLNGSISGGAGSSLTSPVPTPSTSPKEKPKVCQACGCVLASHSPPPTTTCCFTGLFRIRNRSVLSTRGVCATPDMILT
jgi:hypothetical protein